MPAKCGAAPLETVSDADAPDEPPSLIRIPKWFESDHDEQRGGNFLTHTEYLPPTSNSDLRTIEGQRKAWDACIDARKVDCPEISGRIGLMLVVYADGRVLRSALWYSELGDGELENCLIEASLDWRFPPQSSGAFVYHPLHWAI